MKTRAIAAITHLLLSALVIFLSLNIIYFIWYPEPFYILYSVFDAVKIVLVVDLVLGPFLTLVIYDKKKSRQLLIRDISTILILQFIALGWGLHITYKMRPLFLVFQGETFYPVIKNEINLSHLSTDISVPSIWQQPETVYVEPVKGDAAIQKMTDILSGGEIKGDMYQTEKYKPFLLSADSKYRQDAIEQAMPYARIQNSKVWNKLVNDFLLVHGGVIENYLIYPIQTDLFIGLIVFNRDDFSFSGLINSNQ